MGAVQSSDADARSDSSIPRTDSDAPISAGHAAAQPVVSSPTAASPTSVTASPAVVAEPEIGPGADDSDPSGLFRWTPPPSFDAVDVATEGGMNTFQRLETTWTLLDRAIRSWPDAPAAQVRDPALQKSPSGGSAPPPKHARRACPAPSRPRRARCSHSSYSRWFSQAKALNALRDAMAWRGASQQVTQLTEAVQDGPEPLRCLRVLREEACRELLATHYVHHGLQCDQDSVANLRGTAVLQQNTWCAALLLELDPAMHLQLVEQVERLVLSVAHEDVSYSPEAVLQDVLQAVALFGAEALDATVQWADGKAHAERRAGDEVLGAPSSARPSPRRLLLLLQPINACTKESPTHPGEAGGCRKVVLDCFGRRAALAMLQGLANQKQSLLYAPQGATMWALERRVAIQYAPPPLKVPLSIEQAELARVRAAAARGPCVVGSSSVNRKPSKLEAGVAVLMARHLSSMLYETELQLSIAGRVHHFDGRVRQKLWLGLQGQQHYADNMGIGRLHNDLLGDVSKETSVVQHLKQPMLWIHGPTYVRKGVFLAERLLADMLPIIRLLEADQLEADVYYLPRQHSDYSGVWAAVRDSTRRQAVLLGTAPLLKYFPQCDERHVFALSEARKAGDEAVVTRMLQLSRLLAEQRPVVLRKLEAVTQTDDAATLEVVYNGMIAVGLEGNEAVAPLRLRLQTLAAEELRRESLAPSSLEALRAQLARARRVGVEAELWLAAEEQVKSLEAQGRTKQETSLERFTAAYVKHSIRPAGCVVVWFQEDLARAKLAGVEPARLQERLELLLQRAAAVSGASNFEAWSRVLARSGPEGAAAARNAKPKLLIVATRALQPAALEKIVGVVNSLEEMRGRLAVGRRVGVDGSLLLSAETWVRRLEAKERVEAEAQLQEVDLMLPLDTATVKMWFAIRRVKAAFSDPQRLTELLVGLLQKAAATMDAGTLESAIREVAASGPEGAAAALDALSALTVILKLEALTAALPEVRAKKARVVRAIDAGSRRGQRLHSLLHELMQKASARGTAALEAAVEAAVAAGLEGEEAVVSAQQRLQTLAADELRAAIQRLDVTAVAKLAERVGVNAALLDELRTLLLRQAQTQAQSRPEAQAEAESELREEVNSNAALLRQLLLELLQKASACDAETLESAMDVVAEIGPEGAAATRNAQPQLLILTRDELDPAALETIGLRALRARVARGRRVQVEGWLLQPAEAWLEGLEAKARFAVWLDIRPQEAFGSKAWLEQRQQQWRCSRDRKRKEHPREVLPATEEKKAAKDSEVKENLEKRESMLGQVKLAMQQQHAKENLETQQMAMAMASLARQQMAQQAWQAQQQMAMMPWRSPRAMMGTTSPMLPQQHYAPMPHTPTPMPRGTAMQMMQMPGGTMMPMGQQQQQQQQMVDAKPEAAPRRRTWKADEDAVICRLVASHGLDFETIAAALPGRTADGVRNRWGRLRGANKLPEPLKGNQYRCAECGELKRGHTCKQQQQPRKKQCGARTTAAPEA